MSEDIMASPRSIRSSSKKKALHSSSAWIDNDNMSESLLGLYTQDEVDEDGSGNYPFSSADHSSDMPDNYLFSSSSQTSRLNDINYLNVAAYIANVTAASLFGAWGIDGYLPTLWRITQDYPTLVTPAAWAHTIWIPIYAWEGIFAAAQLHHMIRSRPMVQEGAKYYFFYSCLGQIAWVILYTLRLFILSFISSVVTLVSLLALLYSQQQVQQHQHRTSWRDFFFVRFPFQLHCGWMFVVTIINFNLMFGRLSNEPGEMLALAILSLSIMLPVACFFLIAAKPADFIIPLVIVWAYIGIFWELRHPKQFIEDMVGEAICGGIRLSSLALAITVLIFVIPKATFLCCQSHFVIHVVELDGSDC